MSNGSSAVMAMDVLALYDRLRERAQAYGIRVSEKSLGADKAGTFNGPSITINTDNNAEERAYFLAHSVGSVAQWALATEESAATYANLRRAKRHKDEDPEAFEKALAGFCAFEEVASEHAAWLLSEVGFSDVVAPYTAFARADLDAMLEFHRTGTAPTWNDFFARWKQRVANGAFVVRPYQPRPIPSFKPVKIETQEIVHEKE